MPSFIKTDTHLTLAFDDGDVITVYNNNENYDAVCAAVKSGDWDLAKKLATPVESVKEKINVVDDVYIEGGVVYYKDIPLHTSLTDRMIKMLDEGYDIKPLGNFLVNLMDNPSHTAVEELYEFLEKSELPITEDGHFLAYKRVDENFRDIYSRKYDNSPGSLIEMPRNMVDDNRNNTCSRGLHFCSREYLPFYGAYPSSKVIMVKINPRDVVSIPTDYNNAKGRCCRYYVVKEMDIKVDDKRFLPEEELETLFYDTENYINSLDENFDEEEKNKSKTVGQYTYDGHLLRTFSSPTEAMHVTDVDSSSIKKVCDGKRKTAGGYKWKWM